MAGIELRILYRQSICPTTELDPLRKYQPMGGRAPLAYTVIYLIGTGQGLRVLPYTITHTQTHTGGGGGYVIYSNPPHAFLYL